MFVFLMSSVAAVTWRKGMNPGMMLRVDEYSVDAMKNVIARYLPTYVNSGLNLPRNYTYEYNSYIPGFSWAIDYQDIVYTDFDLNMSEVKFELTRMEDKMGNINMDFPALHYWAISAIQEFHHWWLPHSSPIFIFIEDLDIDVGFDLALDDNGYLDPVVYDLKIDFGDSYIKHDNFYVEFLMYQLIELGKVIIQNSAWAFGDLMFSSVLGPMLDTYLVHYTHTFKHASWI